MEFILELENFRIFGFKLVEQLGIGVIELLLKRGVEGFLFIEPRDAIGKNA